MSDLPAGLHLPARSVRVRQLARPAEGALCSGYDIWSALDFYFSEFRDRYLAGAVKGVMTRTNAKHASVFETFSVVVTPISQRPAARELHRARLLEELRFQYKNTVARAAGGSARRAKRLRNLANRTLATIAPPIAAVDAIFADLPEAIAAGAEIKALHQRVEEMA